jgi:non-ribosomal peptide synthetase component E (peptide arylation enzyme)
MIVKQEREGKEVSQRADLLAAKLRELGIDPSDIIGKK